MTNTYTYSLLDDFGGSINIKQLEDEIKEVLVTVNLSGIIINGDSVEITFDAALSPGREIILNNFILSFITLPTIWNVFDFITINSSDSPYRLSKKSVKLNTASGDITVILPKANRNKKVFFGFQKIHALNTVTIEASEGGLIDGQNTKLLTDNKETVILKSNGTSWVTASDNDETSVTELNIVNVLNDKGDIMVDSGTSEDVLPVGNDNYSIVADSTEKLGMKWTQIDHTHLTNIGSNTHAQIDTHLALSNEHLDWTSNQGSSKIHQNNITESSITQHEEAIDINNLSGAPTGSVVGTTDNQTLSNKTFTLPKINDTSSDHKYIFGVSELTDNRTITLPLLSNSDTFVFANHNQTLQNKTINTANNTLSVAASDINTGTLADARVASSNVTQHESLINHDALLNYVENEHLDWAQDQGSNNIHLNNITATSVTQHEGSITISNLIGAPTGSVVGTTDSQTLTNKTIGDNLDLNNNKITNLATPTADSDAVNKSYVDGLASSLDIKNSVKAASTIDLDSNSSISGTITYNNTGGSSGRGQITATLVTSDTFILDDVNFSSSYNGSRILLKNQTNGDENGIWTTSISGTSLTLDRATDFDTDAEVTSGAFMFIEEGTLHDNSGFVLSTNNPITIGGASGTNLTFTQFSGAGQLLAGNGLIKSNDTIDVVGSETIITNADSLEVNSSNLQNQVLLSSGTVGTAATFGALPLDNTNAVSGTLPVSKGGSGVSTFTAGNFLQGNGTSAITATKVVPSGAVVGTTDSQTLTNKTISTVSNSITVSASDVTSGTFDDQRISVSNVTQHEGFIAIENLSGAPTGTVVGTTDAQTLTNKTIDTSSNTITIAATDVTSGTLADGRVAASNVIQHEASITLGNLIGAPTGSVVGTTDTQTLTNKTINTASNSITINASDVGAGTFADQRIAASNVTQHESSITVNNLIGAPIGSVVGDSDTQTLTNKTFSDATTFFADSGDSSKKLQLQLSGITTGTTRTISIPDANTTMVGTNNAQTLSNKSFNDTTTEFVSTSGPTKKLLFDITGATTSTTLTLVANQTANRVVTLPNATDTLVGRATTDTLSNKTIDTASNSITIAAADIISGTFADQRVASSNVIQHEASINHDNLTGFVANEHIDHSTVSIVAGEGLSGGGTITETRTVNLDINSLTEDSSPIGSTDYIVTYDASATSHKKVLINNLPKPYSGIAIGDILVYDGTDYVRLARGNNGEVLTINTEQDIDLVWQAPSGENNTATNVGTSGVGLYKTKFGTNLQFKNINSTSTTSGISVVDDTVNDEVDIRLSINSLTADISPVGSTDYIVTYDASAGNHKKVLLDDLPIGGSGDVTGPGSSIDQGLVRFNGTNGKTVESVGIRHYGASATDPVSPVPSAGDMYYNTVINHLMCYDGSRSKWLSMTSMMDGCGRNGSTSANAFYRRWNGMVMSSTLGPFVPKGTLVYIGFGCNTSGNHTLEVLVGGVVVAELSSGGAAANSSSTINADFDAGIMSFRNKSGSVSTSNFQASVYFKLRA